MSKKDWFLLGYLGYKTVKNEPDRLGKEIGECLIGLIFVMIMGLVIYIVMTLGLNPPSFITDNINLIGFLIFVTIIIIAFCFIYGEIIRPKLKLKKFKKDSEQKKDLEVKRFEKEKNIVNYNPTTSKYKVCMECGHKNPKNLSECQECSADLTKQKQLSNIKFTKNYNSNEIIYGSCPACGHSTSKNTKNKTAKKCPKCGHVFWF